jgi:hypothetical protein
LVGSDCGLGPGPESGAGTTLGGVATGCAATNDRRDEGAIEFNQDPAGNDFYSLGLGGTLTFQIMPDFTGPGAVFEVTYPSNHLEAVEIYVSDSNGSWGTPIATIGNNSGSPDVDEYSFAIVGTFSHIGFKDVSSSISGTASTDGFDIAAFSVTPVPIPGAVWLFGSAMLGLLGIGYGRKAAA